MPHALKSQATNPLSLLVFLSSTGLCKRRRAIQNCLHSQPHHHRIPCVLLPSPGGLIRLPAHQHHKSEPIRSTLLLPSALLRLNKARRPLDFLRAGHSHRSMGMLLTNLRLSLHSNQEREIHSRRLLPIPYPSQSDFRHYRQQVFSSKIRVCWL